MVLGCNWRYMSDHLNCPQERTFLYPSTPVKPEHIDVPASKAPASKAPASKAPVSRESVSRESVSGFVLPPNAHLESDCRGVASILSRVADKWSVLVIMLLSGGRRRVKQFKRLIGGSSHRML